MLSFLARLVAPLPSRFVRFAPGRLLRRWSVLGRSGKTSIAPQNLTQLLIALAHFRYAQIGSASAGLVSVTGCANQKPPLLAGHLASPCFFRRPPVAFGLLRSLSCSARSLGLGAFLGFARWTVLALLGLTTAAVWPIAHPAPAQSRFPSLPSSACSVSGSVG